jgi:DNA mismatch repair protein MutL
MTFVNGRLISSPILSLPLREACDGVLAKGLHPPAVLFFEMDPSSVDCNVHPAKREVRFRDPGVIRATALQAARSAWGTAAPALEAIGPGSDPLFPPIIKPSWSPSVGSHQQEFAVQEPDSARVSENPESISHPPSAFSLQPLALSARYLGQIAGRYLLFEEQEGLMMVEIRAARERILYERFLARLESGELESQQLLLPEVLEMSQADIAWIAAHRSVLHSAGLVAEPFGQGSHGKASLKVDAVPADASSLPVLEIVVRMVDDLRTLGDEPTLENSGRRSLAASVSSLASAGSKLPSGEEAAGMLLRELLACDLPYATPQGRPTMTQMGPGELSRRFMV